MYLSENLEKYLFAYELYYRECLDYNGCPVSFVTYQEIVSYEQVENMISQYFKELKEKYQNIQLIERSEIK